jgi:hypothetical protein
MATVPTAPKCYHPEAFTPDDKPLLSVDQWRKLQMFLETAIALPTTADKYPDSRALPLFAAIQGSSAQYKASTLPSAAQAGQAIYSFSVDAQSHFDTLAALVSAPEDCRPQVIELYDDIISSAKTELASATKVSEDTKAYAGVLRGLDNPLRTLVAQIAAELGPLGDQFRKLSADVDAQNKRIQDAQDAILSDRKVIHDTVYYAWIPIIGTIVAIAEIKTHNDDINAQMAIISDATGQVYKLDQQLRVLSDKISHLQQAQTLLQNQTTVLESVLPIVIGIAGSWNRIVEELQSVQGAIQKSDEQAMRAHPCLAETALATAAKEYAFVADDAHDFMANFWMAPAPTSEPEAT